MHVSPRLIKPIVRPLPLVDNVSFGLVVVVDSRYNSLVKSFALGVVEGFVGTLLIMVLALSGLLVGFAVAIYICGEFEVAFWIAMVIGGFEMVGMWLTV